MVDTPLDPPEDPAGGGDAPPPPVDANDVIEPDVPDAKPSETIKNFMSQKPAEIREPAGIAVDDVVDSNLPNGKPSKTIKDFISQKPAEVRGPAGIAVVETLPAVAAAGVDLVKIVLKIVVMAIVVLMLYLTLVDLQDGSSASNVYNKILNQASFNSGFTDVEAVDAVLKVLSSGASDPKAKVSDLDILSAKSLEDELTDFRLISDDQRSVLNRCFPYPEGEDRLRTLQSCTDILKRVEGGMRPQGLSLERLKLMVELSKDLETHQAAFHSFWVQMAQMVLLNLLLPLLTGLFGDIFGTRQGQGKSDGST